MMLLLRLTQYAESTPGRYRIEVALEGDGPRRTVSAPLVLAITAQDREDLRWYFEDFLQFPFDPAPAIASRIEARMADLGDALFRAVFHADDDARDLWATLRDRLGEARVEVVTDARHAAAVPWELLRDPRTQTPLALRARAFVRSHPAPAERPRGVLPADAGPIRILLVICRPGGGKDVPFRSVASRLIKGLGPDAHGVELDVLRPPTFAELGRVLRAARDRGKPYHVVHFDGHGTYLDAAEMTRLSDLIAALNPHTLGVPRKGAHGYLLFESLDATAKERGQLVDGPSLGKLLVETGVPVLVLNACRSAHADPPPEPVTAEGSIAADEDPHGDVASFGSLALEVMETGVSGVIAMRYNVYVVTAAQFVADLYAALLDGLPLGEAVTRGRKQLHDQPLREIAFDPRSLQDWPVPVVYEALPLPLFPVPSATKRVTLSLGEDGAWKDRTTMDGVPLQPDAGFFGRDETLLALDRAFDRHKAVLLYAFAGSGKTSTAAEFARWYAQTGGVKGSVLFTSFERRKPLSEVLDPLGRVFKAELKQNGIEWPALSDAERRKIALQLLKQVQVLWLWDNVEQVAGFPEGTASAWSTGEQRELGEFLREARDTRAKFLLTSRRDERGWLGDLPARVAIPPMPMQERVQLARALADKRGERLDKIEDWRPLLELTQGNPLAIMVMVGQALRDRLKTREQIEAFAARLRAGESAFEDEVSEGRSRSLGASLSYGFESAFNEAERKQLALLHLFQGFANVEVLIAMGHPEAEGSLPEVRGLTREAGIRMLDRASEIGLISSQGQGRYSIHPALPWYFRGAFNGYYTAEQRDGQESDAARAVRAFVHAMGSLGDLYLRYHIEGRRNVIAALEAEEPNLLHARELARRNGWWEAVVGPMQGLRALYEHTGRGVEWARLVAQTKVDFVDPDTGGPLPGREDAWLIVNAYLVRASRETRQWAEAERLQRAGVALNRARAASALTVPPGSLDASQRNAIRELSTALHELAEIQRELGLMVCIATYQESAAMDEYIGDRDGKIRVAFSLGTAYKDLRTVRDLEKSEQCYRRSLELHTESQTQGRAKCLNQLGLIAFERFQEARVAKRPTKELVDHLSVALTYHHKALALLPPSAVADLAVTHSALGCVYGEVGGLDRALLHYQEAIQHEEKQGNLFQAASIRFNVAVDLVRSDRLADAGAYAMAALRAFETYGDRAHKDVQQTQNLLAYIDQLSKSQAAP